MSVHEVPPPGEPAAPEMSSLARVPTVLWSPARAFASIAARPTVLVVLLTLVVFQMIWTAALYQPVFSPFQKAQMAERMGDMSPAQRAAAEQQVRGMDTPTGRMLGMVFAIIAVGIFYPVALLVWAAILYFVFTLMLSGRAEFKSVLSVTLYAATVDILHSLAVLPVALPKQDPRVYFGPAALMDAPFPPTFLYVLLTRVDLFSLWAWVLAGVGLAVLYRKKTGQALAAVGIVFVLVSVLTAFIQVMMGKMFGGMG